MLILILIIILTYVLSYFLTRRCLIIIKSKKFRTSDDYGNYGALQFVFWIPILNILMSSCLYISYIFEDKAIDADVFFRIKDKKQ